MTEGISTGPFPVEEMPEGKPLPIPKKNLIFVLGGLLLLALGTAEAISLVKQRQETKTRATACNYPDNPTHPCNGHDPGWSTCDNSGRWGCDQFCNYENLPDTWCEGTTQKVCANSTITETPNSPDCGYGPTPGSCYGKQAKSYCEGVEDGNGTTTVLNCTGTRQNYTCQKNHTRFTTKSACDAAEKTNEHPEYSGLSINSGERADCSVSAGGDCDIGQADILDNGTMISGLCWDTTKSCICPTTPTPSLTATPTSTPTSTPIPTSTPTATPTPTPTSTPTNTPTPTSTPIPTATPTPVYSLSCSYVYVYNESWQRMTDLSTLRIGQRVYLALKGQTDHPAGITKARFRVTIDSVAGNWQETTQKNNNGEFYLSYTVPKAGNYEVEGMVYNPNLGWK